MRDIFLISHFIGLAMGLGTAFAHAFLGFAASKLSSEEASNLRNNSKILSRMGSIGLILLIVSGVYLLIPYWPAISFMPWLIVKLILVVILVILIALLHIISAKTTFQNAEIQIRKTEILGKISLICTLIIVVAAVLAFH
jgi:uncharacterized membrane protein